MEPRAASGDARQPAQVLGRMGAGILLATPHLLATPYLLATATACGGKRLRRRRHSVARRPGMLAARGSKHILHRIVGLRPSPVQSGLEICFRPFVPSFPFRTWRSLRWGMSGPTPSDPFS
eukprot:349912-Chlamydomonas_euryale.AAC.1